jgi:predicted PurR-regulated permease PerM
VDTRQTAARIALAAALAVAGLWIGAAFVPAVLWAGVVAVAVDPLRRLLLDRLPGRHATVAAIITVGVALLVVVPLALAVTQALTEAHALAEWLATARSTGIPVPAWVANLPFGAGEVAAWWSAHLATPDAAAQQLERFDTAMLIEHSRTLGQSLLKRAIIFAFTVVTLFFIVRDRDAIVRQLSTAVSRAFGGAGPRLGRQILASIRGTIDGLVLVGLAQGVVMAVIYLVAGVPHPILLGMVSGLGAMVPFGLIAVMLIAVFLLVIKGAIVTAIVVGALGSVLNFSADHFVRPALIGGATRLPFVWVLIGIVGGVETIGLLGLFVGPAVMAALVLVWREFVAEGAPEVPEP